MNQEQNMHSESMPQQRSFVSARTQERHERRMAKQAARAERRAARAQRPRRDWTFEVRAGEKVYTFTWRWHAAELQTQVVEEARMADVETENEPDMSELDQ